MSFLSDENIVKNEFCIDVPGKDKLKVKKLTKSMNRYTSITES